MKIEVLYHVELYNPETNHWMKTTISHYKELHTVEKKINLIGGVGERYRIIEEIRVTDVSKEIHV